MENRSLHINDRKASSPIVGGATRSRFGPLAKGIDRAPTSRSPMVCVMDPASLPPAAFRAPSDAD